MLFPWHQLPVASAGAHSTEQDGGGRLSGIVAMAVAERDEKDDDAADESSATQGLVSGTEKARTNWNTRACCSRARNYVMSPQDT